MMKHLYLTLLLAALFLCACGSGTSRNTVTAQMALEGVTRYCHATYDWSPAQDNPSLMSVEMGQETDSLYQVTFRSYTGALVYFYVDKATGTTRMVEHVPTLGIEEEAGTIELFDYIGKDHSH